MADRGKVSSQATSNDIGNFIGQNNDINCHISDRTDVQPHNKIHTDDVVGLNGTEYEVGGVNCDKGDQPWFQYADGTSTKFLPRLVFLDSEENITNRNYSDNCVNETLPREERSASDSIVLTKSDYSKLHSDSFANTVDRHNDFLLKSHHSRVSVHSSDSDLITDHNMSVENDLQNVAEEDIDHFLQEHESAVSNIKDWHCHRSTVKIPPDKMARNQLVAVSVLCLLFMVGEAVGGIIANSLALFTDVLHLGSDLISFLISLLAMYLAKRPATVNMSFGYHRAEVLGALISVFIIWGVTGVLIYVAVERIVQEHYKEVKPDEMLITAVLGVVFNIVMGIVLHSEICCGGSRSRPSFGHGHSHGSHSGDGHSHSDCNGVQRAKQHRTRRGDYEPLPDEEENLQMSDGVDHGNPEVGDAGDVKKPHPKNINVRAAFIHVIGDIIQSLGVLIASVIMKLKPDDKYKMADPICTFLFSILVLITTVNVFRDTLRIILEGVPRDTSYSMLKSRLQNIPGVQAVHGLTVWCLTLEKNAMAVHLAIDTTTSHERVLAEASQMLKEHYNFLSTTIQVEYYKAEIMTKCFSCQELKN